MDIGSLSFSKSNTGWSTYFLHNLYVNVLLVLGGILLGIPTLIILLVNSFITGFQFSQSFITGQIADLLFGIMPHGIFEIPASILSAALGFQISSFIYVRIFHRNNASWDFIKFTKQCILIIILTCIAAMMEAFVHLHSTT
jgi:stage II sporulation protein M